MPKVSVTFTCANLVIRHLEFLPAGDYYLQLSLSSEPLLAANPLPAALTSNVAQQPAGPSFPVKLASICITELTTKPIHLCSFSFSPFSLLSSLWLILLSSSLLFFLKLLSSALLLFSLGSNSHLRAAGSGNRPRATPKDFLHFRSRNRLPVVGKSAYPRNAETGIKSSHRHGFRRGG